MPSYFILDKTIEKRDDNEKQTHHPSVGNTIYRVFGGTLLGIDQFGWNTRQNSIVAVALIVVGARSADALARILGDVIPGWTNSVFINFLRKKIKEIA